jgi:hypothetical protein
MPELPDLTSTSMRSGGASWAGVPIACGQTGGRVLADRVLPCFQGRLAAIDR